jgi:GR25 family glycosyltransferase involved in LPS biosynthesis
MAQGGLTCLYINLDRATARREALEASFRASAPPGWTLRRIPAVSAAEIGDLPGACSAREKACFKSHRKAIATALEHPGPVLIVEDDTSFSRTGLEVLQQISHTQTEWEVVFTDVCPLNLNEVYGFARQREVFEESRRFKMNDLREAPFWAACGYMVPERSKRRLLDLTDVAVIDDAYDNLLCDLIKRGEIKAAVPVPFLTQLALSAEESQIQERDQYIVHVLHVLRRLLFVDRDLAACDRYLETIAPRTERPGRRFGLIMAALF